MKIFKSLNCVVCADPFARIANQARSPMALDCGKAMCQECFYRERSTQQADRKHQCEYGDTCFGGLNIASFLIVVLSQDSLKLSPMRDGYFLCKPFKLPQCPICDDEYSKMENLEGKSPFCLWNCNHIICTSCYEKTRFLTDGSDEDDLKYEIECPICSEVTLMGDNKLEGQLRGECHSEHFLTELPEMTRQLEEMYRAAYRFCEECKRAPPIEDMFHCQECDQNICARCGLKNHGAHEPLGILEMEAMKYSDQLQKRSINEINKNKKVFPELHEELADDLETFGTKLLAKEKNLKQASNFKDLQKKLDKYTQLNTMFEDTSTLYGDNLRKYNAEIKDLIKYLDDDIN